MTAANEAMGHYLHGCAHLIMARTPREALAQLHKAQTGLLRHSADTIAKAARLWHKQSAELIVIPAAHARTPR